MQDHECYELTPLGESELRASATTLSVAQIELLVRIDRTLTVAQIRASVPSLPSEKFEATFRELLAQHLLALAADDPFAVNIQAQISSRPVS